MKTGFFFFLNKLFHAKTAARAPNTNSFWRGLQVIHDRWTQTDIVSDTWKGDTHICILASTPSLADLQMCCSLRNIEDWPLCLSLECGNLICGPGDDPLCWQFVSSDGHLGLVGMQKAPMSPDYGSAQSLISPHLQPWPKRIRTFRGPSTGQKEGSWPNSCSNAGP